MNTTGKNKPNNNKTNSKSTTADHTSDTTSRNACENVLTAVEEGAPMLALEIATKRERPKLINVGLEQLADWANVQGITFKFRDSHLKLRVMLYQKGDYLTENELLAALRGEEESA